VRGRRVGFDQWLPGHRQLGGVGCERRAHLLRTGLDRAIFDTLGQPHGPITGYLFHNGLAGALRQRPLRRVVVLHTAPAASVNTPPNHTTKIFCYNQAAGPLCNAGHSSTEFEAGVWKNITQHPARINPVAATWWQRRRRRDLQRCRGHARHVLAR